MYDYFGNTALCTIVHRAVKTYHELVVVENLVAGAAEEIRHAAIQECVVNRTSYVRPIAERLGVSTINAVTTTVPPVVTTCTQTAVLLWPPYVIRQTIIFLPCDFYLLLFSSPNLSGRRLDVYHTATHGVTLVQI